MDEKEERSPSTEHRKNASPVVFRKVQASGYRIGEIMGFRWGV